MANQYKRKLNKIDIKDDYAIIHTVSYGIPKEILIDLEDIDLVRDYTWSINNDGYVRSKINSKTVFLHKILIKCQKNKVIDHINRNKLDNRKSNLRVCSIMENIHNRGLFSNNTSGYNGVCFNPNNKHWRAYITRNKINFHLGNFKNKEDAIIARQNAEKFFKNKELLNE